MNTMFSTVGLALIVMIFLVLALAALLVALQVWLCGKGKRLGLVLPALSLLLSLALVFLMAGSAVGSGGSYLVTDENGRVIREEQIQETHLELTPGAAGALVGVFLVSNIPTAIFGGIWLHCKNRRDFQEDLRRMKIEDLE